MLAKKKEKDVIDRMLDQIDFHGMTAEELADSRRISRRKRFTQTIDKPFLFTSLRS